MKTTVLKYFMILMLAFTASHTGVKACDQSDLTFLGITGTGPFVISVRLCVGMGITGSTLGGDQSTRGFMLAFWDSQAGFAISSFTPATVTGPPTTVGPTCPSATVGCTNNGSISTILSFQGSNAVVRYAQGGAPCGTNKAYGCVTTTCLCGPSQKYCTIHTITVNQVPDSMRATAIEGAGNNIAGCYPNADMLVNFNLLLSVVWGELSGEPAGAGVNVKWSTMEESNSDYFIVERSLDGIHFQEIAQVPAAGNSATQLKYSYLDKTPTSGQNLYRLVSVDKAGGATDSRAIEVNYFTPGALSWGVVGPNPTMGLLDMSFFAVKKAEVVVQVFDIAGKRMISTQFEAIEGGNAQELDLSNLETGTYYITLQQGAEKLTRKVVKI
jgi:Secretion system C-terminal sorting domain